MLLNRILVATNALLHVAGLAYHIFYASEQKKNGSKPFLVTTVFGGVGEI